MRRCLGTLFLCGCLYAGAPQARIPGRTLVIVLSPMEPDLPFLWEVDQALGTGPAWVRMDPFDPCLLLIRRQEQGRRFLQDAREVPAPVPPPLPSRRTGKKRRPAQGRPMELVIRVETEVFATGIGTLSNPDHRWR
jgi:hypothetical protein